MTTLAFDIPLAEVKAFLGYDEDDETRDGTLSILVRSALATLKSITGRNLVFGRYRDTFSHFPQKVYLREWPVTSIISVKIGESEIPVSDYEVFLSDGLLYFNSPHPWHFNTGGRGCYTTQLLRVEYDGGYATLPDEFYTAMLAGVQAIDIAQRQFATHGGVLKRLTVNDVGTTEFLTPTSANSNVSVLRGAMEGLLQEFLSGAVTMGTPNLHESELLVGSP